MTKMIGKIKMKQMTKMKQEMTKTTINKMERRRR